MANPKPELSKQEILESIGRIVSEGEGRGSDTEEVAPPEAAPTPDAGEDDDILDLVDMVDEQGNVIHLDRVRDGVPEAAKEGPAREEQVLEALRPMLQTWLDTHMPPIVERLVKRELEQTSSRAKSE